MFSVPLLQSSSQVLNRGEGLSLPSATVQCPLVVLTIFAGTEKMFTFGQRLYFHLKG
jgi:hypothetical protein